MCSRPIMKTLSTTPYHRDTACLRKERLQSARAQKCWSRTVSDGSAWLSVDYLLFALARLWWLHLLRRGDKVDQLSFGWRKLSGVQRIWSPFQYRLISAHELAVIVQASKIKCAGGVDNHAVGIRGVIRKWQAHIEILDAIVKEQTLTATRP